MSGIGKAKAKITHLSRKALETNETSNLEVLNLLLSDLDKEYVRFEQLAEQTECSDDDVAKYYEKCQSARLHLVQLGATVKPPPSESSEKSEFATILENQQRLISHIFGDGTTLPKVADVSSVKLPELVIPTFSGKVIEWPQFHDLFVEVIHSNKRLNDVQRFQYLKAALKDEAAAVIASITISNANYQIAWKRLEDRYNKPLFLVKTLISDFLKCKTVSSDLANFKSVVNNARTTVDLLDSQGEYAKSRDPWVITLICEKLDKETNRLWSRQTASKTSPSLAEFFEFLERRCFESEIETPERSERRNQSIKANLTVTGKCFFCQGDHGIMKCSAFLGESYESRENSVKRSARCFNCLGKGHSVRNCSSKHSCSICKLRHHTLLHNSSSQPAKTSTPSSSNTLEPLSPASPIVQANTSLNASAASILPTAVLNAVDIWGRSTPIRVLLDSGSQANFLSESVCSRLGIRGEQHRVPISRLGDDSQIYSKGVAHVTLKSLVSADEAITVKVHILPVIMRDYPSHNVHIKSLNDIRRSFRLADPMFFQRSNVDMILGSSFLFSILKSERFIAPDDRIYLQNTRIGYLVCSKEPDPSDQIHSNHAMIDWADDLSHQLERFWIVDDVPMASTKASPADLACETIFRDSVTRLTSGRFSVRLPFLSNRPKFQNTHSIALRRFQLLERRLAANDQFRSMYSQFMEEYISLGHMTHIKVAIEDLNFGHYYVIPHHGILQAGNKLRVVFDASARDAKGISLNDQLHAGPSLQAHIVDVLTRFRLGSYTFTCDIAKMYRQILVEDQDRNYQVIIWRNNPNAEYSIYRLNTVTYGLKSSPFLALRVLNELASMYLSKFPIAANSLINNRYVDDILYSNNSYEETVLARDELIKLLSLGGFELRKWTSNEPSIIADCPKEHLANHLNFTDENQVVIPMLGVSWHQTDDAFTFKLTQVQDSKFTKRNLIAETARIYDPLGFIAPVMVKLKCLIQETWISRTDWDEQVAPNVRKTWVHVRSTLPSLERIKLPRHLGRGLIELHGFADASKSAYAAVVYSRVVSEDRSITTRLIIAKTKLAPIKTISIPRLELCAAHLLAKLIPVAAEALNVPNEHITLWSDSKTVLAWLKALPRKWTVFVANRVSEIQSLDVKWTYVSSKSNPADLPSRGMAPEDLVSSQLWWYGPEFLQDFDITLNTEVIPDTEHEVAPIRCNTAMVEVTNPNDWESFTVRFSNFNRLVRSMAYVFRARDWFMKRTLDMQTQLTTSEVESAWWFLVRNVQANYFSSELKAIRQNKRCSKSSVLHTLSPSINSDGILVANTRLLNIETSLITASPIILPNIHLTILLIRKVHVDMLHVGPRALCSSIRQTYWIPGLMRSVKRVCRSCPTCTRFKAKTYTPDMGPLPEYRLGESKPFLISGLDFAGPIMTKPYRGKGKIILKSYIALFVCTSTKAVHIELIMDLSVESLIMGIRRFLARRGRCATILSDNGRNFVGCNRVLTEFRAAMEKNLVDPTLSEFITNNLMKWKFIPPYSPHIGGLWEAGIRSVKTHLRKGFADTCLTIEELQTALAQIEGILNSRPLSPIKFHDSEIPITSAHLLTGYVASGLPDDLKLLDVSSSVRIRQAEQRALVSEFWQRWRTDYLPTIMRKPKWATGSKNPAINDLVLIKRTTDPPRYWAMGRISKLYFGSDGVARVADVFSAGRLRREAVRHLIPLNVESEASTGGENVRTSE